MANDLTSYTTVELLDLHMMETDQARDMFHIGEYAKARSAVCRAKEYQAELATRGQWFNTI